MTANEKWDLIVKEFNAHKSAKEDEIQRLWENIFAEIFEYSRLNGEIESHRTMRIGANERVIPDIIVKDRKFGKDLFIVELKQPLFRGEQKYKEQLFSYMKLFRINVGVLICNEIWLFMFDKNDTEISMSIEFSSDCKNGCEFVEMFGKGSFDESKVNQFIKNDIEQRLQIKKKSERINEILADIRNHLPNIVKSYYSSKYANDEIEQALKGLSFNVIQNETVKPSDDSDLNLTHEKLNKHRDYTHHPGETKIEHDYGQFLKNKGYTNNTILSYTSALKSICAIEGVTIDTLFNDIEKYAPAYRKTGEKNHLGEKGHGTWRNALNRLLDFYLSTKMMKFS